MSERFFRTGATQLPSPRSRDLTLKKSAIFAAFRKVGLQGRRGCWTSDVKLFSGRAMKFPHREARREVAFDSTPTGLPKAAAEAIGKAAATFGQGAKIFLD